MRKVTIYTSQGTQEQEVTTDVALWGELQAVLTQQGVSHKKMKAVVGNTRVTLESPQAQLPEGDFILFLMTKKNKSGAIDPKEMSYADLKTAIKEILAGFEDKKELAKAKKFFANGDRNYTQTGTEYMRKRLLAWIKKHGTKSVPRKTTAKKVTAKKVEKKAEKKAKTETFTTDTLSTTLNTIDKVRDSNDFTKEENAELDKVYGDLNELIQGIEARQKAEKENVESKKKAKSDMKDLSREFEDVKDIY